MDKIVGGIYCTVIQKRCGFFTTISTKSFTFAVDAMDIGHYDFHRFLIIARIIARGNNANSKIIIDFTSLHDRRINQSTHTQYI